PSPPPLCAAQQMPLISGVMSFMVGLSLSLAEPQRSSRCCKHSMSSGGPSAPSRDSDAFGARRRTWFMMTWRGSEQPHRCCWNAREKSWKTRLSLDPFCFRNRNRPCAAEGSRASIGRTCQAGAFQRLF
ncbi:unnamed protein product, partial [Scytosiphon promiscuus]